MRKRRTSGMPIRISRCISGSSCLSLHLCGLIVRTQPLPHAVDRRPRHLSSFLADCDFEVQFVDFAVVALRRLIENEFYGAAVGGDPDTSFVVAACAEHSSERLGI